MTKLLDGDKISYSSSLSLRKNRASDEPGGLEVAPLTELRGVLVNPHHIVLLSKTHFPPKVHINAQEAEAQSQHG